ncbi:hypothetical protein DCAR_0625441 [Daucus carota subsp. sativus]|uniref:Uncharacterized protein n=1 Tax=Daucus carota subsp. sativus TaxID=79200 RepID=A0A164WFZ8_DAUCS|nr:hypothetical protein DCAR_0625441 [Daucus carota subsp. sativus]
MADSSRRRNGPVHRSHSPSRAFCSSSPPRVSLYASSNTSSPSISFSIDRPNSPSRSISVTSRNQILKKPSSNQLRNQKRTCMCSPTNHPGSFRCSLHRNMSNQTASYPSNRLNARRSAMTNSLVRIGTVEGDLMKRALSALIRPSSHHQKRRGSFESRPSRLSIMSKAED